MPRIDIDDELFRYLQSNAVAYVETPNDTLRRLLQLDKAAKGVVAEAITAAPVSRKPKASLGRMIQAGLIKNGQKLHLRDYQGREVPGAVAYIGGDGVFADARRQRLYSMSDLAQELLKKQGYESSSVRGPSHWFTDDGRSITDIWEKHLRQSA